MGKLFREGKVRRFKSGSMPGFYVHLDVAEDGNPVFVSWGCYQGGCDSTPKDIDFDKEVERVMGMLVDDVDQFRQMRDSLNPKYKEMAERVRKRRAEELIEKSKKYDF